MRDSKLFSCISFSTFCFSTIASTNSVFAENFLHEKKFLELFISGTEKLKCLDENKLEKSKEVFLSTLISFDKRFQFIKNYEKFFSLVSNLDAVVKGKLRVITCLDGLLKVFKNDIGLLRRFLKNVSLESKGNIDNFASEIVNKVDEFFYSGNAKSNRDSIDLHNLLGDMYGKTQKLAFVDQLFKVCNSIIWKQVGKKEISGSINGSVSELKIMSDILKVDSASLFAAFKLYKRLKNKSALKEKLKRNELVSYLDEDEEKSLRSNGPLSYSACLAGAVEKLLLYPTADGCVIKSVNEGERYALDNDFFKILVNVFKKSSQLKEKEKGKDSHEKQFTKKKRKLFGVFFSRDEEKSNTDNNEGGCDGNLAKAGCSLFKVIHLNRQGGGSLDNKEKGNKRNLNGKKLDSKGKVDPKDEIEKISNGLDFVQNCLNSLFSSEKPSQQNA